MAAGNGVDHGAAPHGELGVRGRVPGHPGPADDLGGRADRAAGALRLLRRAAGRHGADHRAPRPARRGAAAVDAPCAAAWSGCCATGTWRATASRSSSSASPPPCRPVRPPWPCAPGPRCSRVRSTAARAATTGPSSSRRSTPPAADSLRADVARLTQEIATRLEGLIRRAPEQWHVFQPLWLADRPGGVGGMTKSDADPARPATPTRPSDRPAHRAGPTGHEWSAGRRCPAVGQRQRPRTAMAPGQRLRPRRLRPTNGAGTVAGRSVPVAGSTGPSDATRPCASRFDVGRPVVVVSDGPASSSSAPRPSACSATTSATPSA